MLSRRVVRNSIAGALLGAALTSVWARGRKPDIPDYNSTEPVPHTKPVAPVAKKKDPAPPPEPKPVKLPPSAPTPDNFVMPPPKVTPMPADASEPPLSFDNDSSTGSAH